MKYKLALFMMESGLLFYKTCKMLPKGCFDFLTEDKYVSPSALDYYAEGIILLKYHTSEVTNMP